ncbi:MAG: cytochrome c [Cyanobacteria bacterium P01_A01_bin.123]
MTQETFETKVNPAARGPQRLVAALVAAVVLIVLVVIGIQHFKVSDPYILEVLSLNGDAAHGRLIFQMNCATCHGLEASGEVGPSLQGISERKSEVGLIEQVIGGKTPPMPQFQPEAEVMADLLQYLETL